MVVGREWCKLVYNYHKIYLLLDRLPKIIDRIKKHTYPGKIRCFISPQTA